MAAVILPSLLGLESVIRRTQSILHHLHPDPKTTKVRHPNEAVIRSLHVSCSSGIIDLEVEASQEVCECEEDLSIC